MIMIMIWKQPLTVEGLNSHSEHTLLPHLGIEVVEVGPDFLTARMPVDERTKQPFGFLHGGASVALAESIGSMAAIGVIEDLNQWIPFGLEINANHIRSVQSGWVYGTGKPLHLGRRTQVWQIEIKDEQGRLVCVSRLTVAVVERNGS